MSTDVWTVDVWLDSTGWTEWSSWVGRAEAEYEKANAKEQGYAARIRPARNGDRSYPDDEVGA